MMRQLVILSVLLAAVWGMTVDVRGQEEGSQEATSTTQPRAQPRAQPRTRGHGGSGRRTRPEDPRTARERRQPDPQQPRHKPPLPPCKCRLGELVESGESVEPEQQEQDPGTGAQRRVLGTHGEVDTPPVLLEEAERATDQPQQQQQEAEKPTYWSTKQSVERARRDAKEMANVDLLRNLLERADKLTPPPTAAPTEPPLVPVTHDANTLPRVPGVTIEGAYGLSEIDTSPEHREERALLEELRDMKVPGTHLPSHPDAKKMPGYGVLYSPMESLHALELGLPVAPYKPGANSQPSVAAPDDEWTDQTLPGTAKYNVWPNASPAAQTVPGMAGSMGGHSMARREFEGILHNLGGEGVAGGGGGQSGGGATATSDAAFQYPYLALQSSFSKPAFSVSHVAFNMPEAGAVPALSSKTAMYLEQHKIP